MANSRFYGKLTATASLIDANYEIETQITRKYLAEILDEQQLLTHITAIQISTCGRYGSVCFTDREILETACGKILRHNISLEPDYYNRTRISIENIPMELNDLLVKELLSNYATIIGQTYYPVETYDGTKYRTGTRVYTVIKIKEHLPLKHYQFGRHLRIRYDGQPKPIITDTNNESEPESDIESDHQTESTTESESNHESELETASESGCLDSVELTVPEMVEIPSNELTNSQSDRPPKRQLGDEHIEPQQHKRKKSEKRTRYDIMNHLSDEYEYIEQPLKNYMAKLKTENWVVDFDEPALKVRLQFLISMIQIELDIHEMQQLKPIVLKTLAYNGLSQKTIKNTIYQPHRPRTFDTLLNSMIGHDPEWVESIYLNF